MIASDIPDNGWTDSTAMARALVTYMACPDAIRSRIKEDFDRPPCTRTIERLRTEYLASLVKQPDAPFKAYEGYHPNDVSDRAAKANRAFVEALKAERELSRLARMEAALRDPQTWETALRSTYLTDPRLVDKAWERSVEATR